MRRLFVVALLAVFPLAPLTAAPPSGLPEPAPARVLPEGSFTLAQTTTYQRRSGKVRPTYRRHGYVRPGTAYRSGSGAAYRPRPGVTYQPRPGVAYRPRGGYYGRPAGAWYPGWRPGWAPSPWYGSYWRPGYGWAAAAGLIAIGVLAANAAVAYQVPPPPNPSYCWFYTDQTYQTGYWAACPPMP